MADKGLIYLSAGGTGGHVSPAASLAAVLQQRGYDVRVLTDQRGLRYRAMFDQAPMRVLASGALAGGLLGALKGMIGLLCGSAQALALFIKQRPLAVIGFGGYPCVPGVLAAQLLGVPTALHEQNAIIGKANLFLAGRARAIALSLPSYIGLSEGEKAKSVVTGNPVRTAFNVIEPFSGFEGGDDILHLYVTGGSLGAGVFSDVVPEALAGLPLDYRRRLSVVQQCREEDLDYVRGVYERAAIKAEIATFFDDMADRIAQAQLVIGRAGASTVAELTVAGRPAIYVPYPHHKDQQQLKNAEIIADQGGAWVMSEDGFTVEALRARMELFFQSPQKLHDAAKAAAGCAKGDAAKKLADLVEDVLEGSD